MVDIEAEYNSKTCMNTDSKIKVHFKDKGVDKTVSMTFDEFVGMFYKDMVTINNVRYELPKRIYYDYVELIGYVFGAFREHCITRYYVHIAPIDKYVSISINLREGESTAIISLFIKDKLVKYDLQYWSIHKNGEYREFQIPSLKNLIAKIEKDLNSAIEDYKSVNNAFENGDKYLLENKEVQSILNILNKSKINEYGEISMHYQDNKGNLWVVEKTPLDKKFHVRVNGEKYGEVESIEKAAEIIYLNITGKSAIENKNIEELAKEKEEKPKKKRAWEMQYEEDLKRINKLNVSGAVKEGLRKMAKNDMQIRELDNEANTILQTSPVWQAPQSYHDILNKMIKLQNKNAEIWNGIRDKVVKDGKTLWQIAMGKTPVVYSGKEKHVDFYVSDVLDILEGKKEEKEEKIPKEVMDYAERFLKAKKDIESKYHIPFEDSDTFKIAFVLENTKLTEKYGEAVMKKAFEIVKANMQKEKKEVSTPLRGAEPVYRSDGSIMYWRKWYKSWSTAEQTAKRLRAKYGDEYNIKTYRIGLKGQIEIYPKEEKNKENTQVEEFKKERDEIFKTIVKKNTNAVTPKDYCNLYNFINEKLKELAHKLEKLDVSDKERKELAQIPDDIQGIYDELSIRCTKNRATEKEIRFYNEKDRNYCTQYCTDLCYADRECYDNCFEKCIKGRTKEKDELKEKMQNVKGTILRKYNVELMKIEPSEKEGCYDIAFNLCPELGEYSDTATITLCREYMQNVKDIQDYMLAEVKQLLIDYLEDLENEEYLSERDKKIKACIIKKLGVKENKKHEITLQWLDTFEKMQDYIRANVKVVNGKIKYIGKIDYHKLLNQLGNMLMFKLYEPYMGKHVVIPKREDFNASYNIVRYRVGNRNLPEGNRKLVFTSIEDFTAYMFEVAAEGFNIEKVLSEFHAVPKKEEKNIDEYCERFVTKIEGAYKVKLKEKKCYAGYQNYLFRFTVNRPDMKEFIVNIRNECFTRPKICEDEHCTKDIFTVDVFKILNSGDNENAYSNRFCGTLEEAYDYAVYAVRELITGVKVAEKKEKIVNYKELIHLITANLPLSVVNISKENEGIELTFAISEKIQDINMIKKYQLERMDKLVEKLGGRGFNVFVFHKKYPDSYGFRVNITGNAKEELSSVAQSLSDAYAQIYNWIKMKMYVAVKKVEEEMQKEREESFIGVKKYTSGKKSADIGKFLKFLDDTNLTYIPHAVINLKMVEKTLFGEQILKNENINCKNLTFAQGTTSTDLDIRCNDMKTVTVHKPSKIIVHGTDIEILKYDGNLTKIIEIRW